MQALLLHAQAQLADALRMVETALRSPSLERAGNLAHDADLKTLAAADLLSRAFAEATARAGRRASETGQLDDGRSTADDRKARQRWRHLSGSN